MRTFSQSEPTRLLSRLQGASLSQQHRLRCHKIQGPYHQYPQVPIVSLVPCLTLPNTISTHLALDGVQRVATKPDFHQQKDFAMSNLSERLRTLRTGLWVRPIS